MPMPPLLKAWLRERQHKRGRRETTRVHQPPLTLQRRQVVRNTRPTTFPHRRADLEHIQAGPSTFDHGLCTPKNKTPIERLPQNK